MPFAPFYELCPDVARQETRTITLLQDSDLGLPAGDYTFIEMFCNEPNCDCRRVFLTVFSATTKKTEALITWGWEDQAYYKRWMGINDPELAREMQGPNLDLSSPQTENAATLLKLASRLLLADPAYVERIKRHYALFRSIVDAPRKQGPKKEVPKKEDPKSRRKRWRRK